jgi:hypothetical protein
LLTENPQKPVLGDHCNERGIAKSYAKRVDFSLWSGRNVRWCPAITIDQHMSTVRELLAPDALEGRQSASEAELPF